MRKRLSVLLLSIMLVLFATGCDACSAQITAVILDDRTPWNMPTVYERSEFSVQKYKMKALNNTTEKDVLLAEGNTVFVLEEAGNYSGIPCVKLSMNFTVTYLDIAENGANRGLSDSITSQVVFQKVSLLPVLSQKSAVLATRRDENGNELQNNSYQVTVDFAAAKSSLLWTQRGEASAAEQAVTVSGQVFDNEEIYFAMRAFSTLSPSGSQSFKLFHALDSHLAGKSTTYNMVLNVAAETVDKYLMGYKGDNNYGFGSEEDRTPTVECMNVTFGKSGDNPGPTMTAFYSAQPFKISENIETSKVLVGLETTEYETNAAYKTFYSLIDYTAVNR